MPETAKGFACHSACAKVGGQLFSSQFSHFTLFWGRFFFIFLFLLLLLFSSAFQVLGLKVCATTAWLWGRVLLFLWLCCLLELPANSSFSTFTSHSPGCLDYKCAPLSLAFYTDSVNQTQVFRLMQQVLLPALSNLWLLNHFQSLC